VTEDEILADYAALRSLVTNVIGFHGLADNDYANDSLGQLKANARVYADGHVLARRVFSLSQRLDEWGEYRDLAAALRPLRRLCADIIGANAWVDDEAAPAVERLMCHALAYAKGVELAVRFMHVHDDLTGKA
jgi:hypothetical protein